MAFSDGSFVEPLNAFQRHAVRLRRYQRAMVRKRKFSQNWKKAKRRVTKQYQKIADARNDFLHQTSTTMAKNRGVVC